MNSSLPSQTQPLRLITIPISHYCEKVRWALTRLKLPYVEESHMPPFHRFATGRVGGKSTPVLITETDAFTDSTDILHYLDEIAPRDAKLYPINPELRQQVEKLEDLFNKQLGVATRRWGYFHVMNDRNLMKRSWCNGAPVLEQFLFPIVFPIFRPIAQQSLNITPDSSAQAYEQIKSIFEKVNELLADGRNYLVGDKLSAADLTFAALAAPTVMPPEHPKRREGLEQLPTKMLSEIKEFRETLAGPFVLRLYRDRNN